MKSICDNNAIGVLVKNTLGDWLMFRHDREPFRGFAPLVTHRDQHQDPVRKVGAILEGMSVPVRPLTMAAMQVLPDMCDRSPGPDGVGHNWTVFTTVTTGDGIVWADEFGEPAWKDANQLQNMAEWAVRYARGDMDSLQWGQLPGLDPVWALLLATVPQAGGFPLLALSPSDRAALLEFSRCHLPGSNLRYLQHAL